VAVLGEPVARSGAGRATADDQDLGGGGVHDTECVAL
jgi:hypothetical protein